MPPRTTATAVRKIVKGSKSTTDFDPFIETANNIVTRVCAPAGYDARTLELIERWLSAHFYLVNNRRPVDEMVGAARNRYEVKVDFGLKLTWHGQQALALDTEGTLISSPVRVEFFWNGVDPPP